MYKMLRTNAVVAWKFYPVMGFKVAAAKTLNEWLSRVAAAADFKR